jgi:hypothetical protein
MSRSRLATSSRRALGSRLGVDWAGPSIELGGIGVPAAGAMGGTGAVTSAVVGA